MKSFFFLEVMEVFFGGKGTVLKPETKFILQNRTWCHRWKAYFFIKGAHDATKVAHIFFNLVLPTYFFFNYQFLKYPDFKCLKKKVLG